MPTSSANHRLPYRLFYGPLFLIALLLAGCEKQESISSYTEPAHESLQTREFQQLSAARKPHESRILGAIVPLGSVMWFFKLQGSPAAVAAHESEFRDLLTSLSSPAPERMEWKLPANWQEKRAKPGEMRYATLEIPGDPPLDVSVSTLPIGDRDPAQRLLDNINRWRNQLDLPFIDAEELPHRVETIPAGQLTATFINLLGKVKRDAAMPPSQMAETSRSQPAQPVRNEPGDIRYEAPTEWSGIAPLPASIASFEVKDGDRRVVITVSHVGGSQAQNLNRWRGQVGLKPLPPEEAAKPLTAFPVGPRTGGFVELKGQDEQGREKTILGLMIPDGEMTVFVKLSGDAKLAEQERSRFDAFAKSVRF